MNPHDTTAVLLPPTPVSFRTVAGLPLIQRTALGALRAGFTRVIALAGGDAARLRAVFDRDPRTRTITVVESADAAARIHPDAVLIPSDCLIFASPSPSALLNPSPRSDWMRVTEANIGAAEDRLIAEIRSTAAATDGPIARFDRAISTRLSRQLVRTPLHPNHLTLIGTAIGLVAAWSFALGSYPAGVIGAVLFWIAIIIDGCDGEVARLTFRESTFGGRLDVITDNVVHAAVFLGLAIGQYRTDPGRHPWLPAVLLLSGFGAACIATWYCLLRDGSARARAERYDSRLHGNLLRGFELLMNRDFAYLLIVLAVIDRLRWFLWGASFGTWLYAGGLVWLSQFSQPAPLSRDGSYRGAVTVERILLVAGVAFFIFLLWRIGVGAVLSNLRLVGWSFGLIVAQELLAYTANTLGWRAAFPPGTAPLGFRSLLAARVAGDAVNTVTPTATIGGEVVRVRLLQGRVDSSSAWAAVTVARISQAVGQAAFVIVGLFIVTRTLSLSDNLRVGVWSGVLLFALALVAAIALQRRGLLTRAVHFTNVLGLHIPSHWAEWLHRVDREIVRFYGRPRALLPSTAWFFVGWAVGVIEIYLILYCFGLADWQRALTIETLTVAIDGLLFFVPAKAGTQEGGKVLIFSLLGLDPAKGLALGIVRRLRELTWAGVGLAILSRHQRARPSEHA